VTPCVPIFSARALSISWPFGYRAISLSSQRIASKGAQGLYTQLYFTADGLANIIYYNRKNDVVIKVTGDIPNWTPSELQTGGGRYLALATNPLDGVASYTWFQPGVAKLRVADIV